MGRREWDKLAGHQAEDPAACEAGSRWGVAEATGAQLLLRDDLEGWERRAGAASGGRALCAHRADSHCCTAETSAAPWTNSPWL